MKLHGLQLLRLALVCALLAGCSSAPPPAPSAEKEISDAERAIEAAQNWDRKNELDLALGEYKRARDLIAKGRSFAEGTELTKLKNMEEELRSATSKLEIRKLAKAAEPEKPKVPEVAATKVEDPEEKKQKEEAEAKKRREEKDKKAQAEIAEKITAGALPPAKKATAKPDDLDPALEVKKADEKAGEKAEDAGPAPIKKADGPYPALTEKSPPVQICKLDVKGKFAVAYIQIFNNGEQGKRIVSWGVFFKDGNQSPVLDARTVAVFPYNGFKPNVPDLIGGQIINGLTTGSEQVTGLDGLRLVAVGEHDRVKDVRTVAVKIAFHDGTNVVGVGPAGAAPNEMPGLKSLEQKK